MPPVTKRVNWKLSSISKQADGLYCLKYDTPEGPQEVQARTVALTVPAYTAADLINSVAVGGGGGWGATPHTNVPVGW